MHGDAQTLAQRCEHRAVIAACGNMYGLSFMPVAPAAATSPLVELGLGIRARGLRRLFSLPTVYETVKSPSKVAGLARVLYLMIQDLRPLLYLPGAHAPAEALRQLLAMQASKALKLALAVFLLALLDLGYTRFEFKHELCMSKPDVKDEVKNREGDPCIRSRLRVAA
ncbi:EscU/YscU/HrcU family type III secretion system export apparatus switch protein [Achromobacter pestifer]|uniref:EscU/YscU/HrcU family type III secretion system export apparatus switch protein n=1 Tax=Achromobacter pestifer TaxID=1353889 RepID=A0A7D4DXL8_9BURK|nr:EscU/YscU/HrcU family type III secretion system export apparatus switch protein [Achromobacter pestifer]QKH36168.1 EscU/YscU/HrcU family type III secretion system export apparatus switch protein [Achromobacter pestifer]